MDPPVVVAVHALATGGSVALSAMADFCLAGRSARFYAAYTGIGLVCDGGGSAFIPRRVGSRRAAEFLLRNQKWSAEEAEAYGLVTAVVDDDALTAEAEALARELAAGPTRAYGEIKNLLLTCDDQPLEAQLEAEAPRDDPGHGHAGRMARGVRGRGQAAAGLHRSTTCDHERMSTGGADRADRVAQDVAANEAARREMLRTDGARTLGENLEQADALIRAAFELADGLAPPAH